MSDRDTLTNPDRQLMRDLRALRYGDADERARGLRALRYRVLAPDEDGNWASERSLPAKMERVAERLQRLTEFRRLESLSEARDAGRPKGKHGRPRPRLTKERLLRLTVSPHAFVGRVVALDENFDGVISVPRGGDSTKGLRWSRPTALD